jgi:hypothetical protein
MVGLAKFMGFVRYEAGLRGVRGWGQIEHSPPRSTRWGAYLGKEGSHGDKLGTTPGP